MKKPDISIGMLTWNRAPMLETCLENLFKSLDPARILDAKTAAKYA